MTSDPSIATAADYADAMMTARRATRVLVLLLVLLLLGQLAGFFVLRYTDLVPIGAATSTTTQPSTAWPDLLHYLLGGCLFLGVTIPIVLCFVLLLIVNIMLVGRLIGVSRVTSAYMLCLVLLVLLFPWQAFLNNVGLTPEQATFKIPGVLYTWGELAHPTLGARFSNADWTVAYLKWFRFVALPVIALTILLAIQIKSNRGMRQALGEEATPNEPIIVNPGT